MYSLQLVATGLLGLVPLIGALAVIGLVAGRVLSRWAWELEDMKCDRDDFIRYVEQHELRGEVRAALARFALAQRRRRVSSGGLDRFSVVGVIHEAK